MTEKTNPITGEITKITAPEVMTGFNMHYGKKNGSYYIETNIHFSGEKNFKIDAGLVLIFKLPNGELLKLKSRDISLPATRVTGGQYVSTYTSYKLMFNCDRTKLEQLAVAGYKALMITVAETDFIDEPNEKVNKKISGK